MHDESAADRAHESGDVEHHRRLRQRCPPVLLRNRVWPEKTNDRGVEAERDGAGEHQRVEPADREFTSQVQDSHRGGGNALADVEHDCQAAQLEAVGERSTDRTADDRGPECQRRQQAD